MLFKKIREYNMLFQVKSGNSNLNSHQKNIKDAILKGRVHWHEFTVDGIWEHETKRKLRKL